MRLFTFAFNIALLCWDVFWATWGFENGAWVFAPIMTLLAVVALVCLPLSTSLLVDDSF